MYFRNKAKSIHNSTLVFYLTLPTSQLKATKTRTFIIVLFHYDWKHSNEPMPSHQKLTKN